MIEVTEVFYNTWLVYVATKFIPLLEVGGYARVLL